MFLSNLTIIELMLCYSWVGVLTFCSFCFPSLLGNVSHPYRETFPVSTGKNFALPLWEMFPIPTGKRFPSLLGNVCHPYWEMFPIHTGKHFPSCWETFPIPTGKGSQSLLGKVSHFDWETYPIHWEAFFTIMAGEHLPFPMGDVSQSYWGMFPMPTDNFHFYGEKVYLLFYCDTKYSVLAWLFRLFCNLTQNAGILQRRNSSQKG